jgi:hypothetical protein
LNELKLLSVSCRVLKTVFEVPKEKILSLPFYFWGEFVDREHHRHLFVIEKAAARASISFNFSLMWTCLKETHDRSAAIAVYFCVAKLRLEAFDARAADRRESNGNLHSTFSNVIAH